MLGVSSLSPPLVERDVLHMEFASRCTHVEYRAKHASYSELVGYDYGVTGTWQMWF